MEVGDISLEMMLWDPGGKEAWAQYNSSFISGASGLMFVVDATKPRTLDHLLEAQTKGRGFIGSRPSILVVNKIDLIAQTSALTKAQLDAAGKLNWYLLQASAKSGDSVDEAFGRLGELMLEARKAVGVMEMHRPPFELISRRPSALGARRPASLTDPTCRPAGAFL